MSELDKLVYGKNTEERIVSIEHHDGWVKIFKEYPTFIQEVEYPSSYWFLTPQPIPNLSIKLLGNQHYKYGCQFDNKKEFFNALNHFGRADIYTIYDAKESCMVNTGITYFKGLTPSDVSLLSFDSETTTLDPKDKNAKILLISATYRKQNNQETRLFSYENYENDGEMLIDFCKYVKECNPSILLGHNIVSFDLPYFYEIAQKYGVSLIMGRDDSPIRFNKKDSKFRVDGNRDLNYKKCFIYGREICDTYFVSIRYDSVTKKYDKYGLKDIIKYEKLYDETRQFYDASLIRKNYRVKEEWEKIKKYAIDDSLDPIKLWDLMIPAIFYFTRHVPKSFQSMIESASGSQLNAILVRSYLQDTYSIPKAQEMTEFDGAISFGQPGIYKNAIRFDVASLYPSIILANKLYDKIRDPNANLYKITKFFTEERLKNKKLAKETGNKYYKDLEQSQKIGINSLYGLQGSHGLNFNNREIANFITTQGREILNIAANWSTSKQFIKKNEGKKETWKLE